jgi:hypothetical protein
MMRRSRTAAVIVLGVGIALVGQGAMGGPIDPFAFTSLGLLNITGGSYTLDTSSDTLSDSGGTVLFTGTTYNGIAVFDFSQIAISNASIGVTGSDPLALLSQGNSGITNSMINVSSREINFDPSPAGPGGFAGGANGPGSGPGGGADGRGSGGGGFGGAGGAGGAGGFATPFGGGIGGQGGLPYGNLGIQLVGGSGGGADGGPGGGGGGAIEFGAAGALTISGDNSIWAKGDGGSHNNTGAGGGIFLHADSVSLIGQDVLDVSGGNGGGPVSQYGDYGGGGGGGQILILSNSLNLSGGNQEYNLGGGNGGSPGTFSMQLVPEPSSIVLLISALPVAAYICRQRRVGSRAANRKA